MNVQLALVHFYSVMLLVEVDVVICRSWKRTSIAAMTENSRAAFTSQSSKHMKRVCNNVHRTMHDMHVSPCVCVGVLGFVFSVLGTLGPAYAGCGCGVGASGWVGSYVLAVVAVFVMLPESQPLSLSCRIMHNMQLRGLRVRMHGWAWEMTFFGVCAACTITKS